MKDIKNYEGLYAITEDGKVWGYKTQKFLKPRINKNGYFWVTLSKNNKMKNWRIHRLVAEAYIPNPNNYPHVNHLDEDKSNNTINNLQWCTAKQNLNHGTRNNRISESLKKSVYCVELDKIYESLMQCAQELNISISGICECCRGTRKTAGGYHWQYI